MDGADLVAQSPEFFQRVRMLAELIARLKADAVDDEVGVGMARVTVGGDQNLVARPGFGRKLQGDLMGLGVGDALLRREGLDVLIEVDPIRLLIALLRQQEFLQRVLAGAVDAGEITPSILVHGFHFLGAVADDAAHGAEGLTLLPDVSYGCHVPSFVMRSS